MIKLSFTEKTIEQLREVAIRHPQPKVRRKGMAVLLHSQGVHTPVISATLGVCDNTVRHCLHEYENGGLEKLTDMAGHRPQSELKSFEARIKDYLEKTPPATIKQACAEIAELTGIDRKETQMRRYLKSLGATHKKVCGIPAKADIKAQQAFKTEQLEPRLEEAMAGQRDVYFVDAAHFVLGAFLGFLWSLTRCFVRTPSGRQRWNVLGALHAVTKQLITVSNATYITSVEVGMLLTQLARDGARPITVVLDNARYQRCRYVMDLAAELKIELLFLPPYSPNLNLIERVWKLTKKEVLNSRYYTDFQQFHSAIQRFLSQMHNTHGPELTTLLALNFQTFTEEQFQKAA